MKVTQLRADLPGVAELKVVRTPGGGIGPSKVPQGQRSVAIAISSRTCLAGEGIDQFMRQRRQGLKIIGGGIETKVLSLERVKLAAFG
jgi:hypothetical protein